MSQKLLIAIHQIELAVEGEKVVKLAGDVFLAEDDIVAKVVPVGAAREATEAELALYEKQNPKVEATKAEPKKKSERETDL